MSILYNPEPNLDGLMAARLMYRNRAGRVLARWLLGLLILILVVMFLPWRQTIRGNGKITAYSPSDRPQTVNATIDGRIEQWLVQEGQFVKAGDSLMRISEVKEKYFDPAMLQRLQEQLAAKREAALAYTQKVQALNEQIQALTAGRTLSLEKADNKLRQASFKVSGDSASVEAARMQVIVADTQYKRVMVLYEKGLKSLTDTEEKRVKKQETEAKLTEAQNKLLTSRNERINARIELSSLGAEYAEKIAKATSDRSSASAYLNDLEATIAKFENEVSSMVVRQGYYTIRAPQSGYVVKALKSGVGEMVKAGDAVVTVMPENPDKAVELYVNAYDLPLLKKGDKVRLQFDGWPALQFSGWPGASFGTFGGEVAVIDYVSTEKNSYRILIKPDPTDEPWPDQLRIGSGAIGWAMLSRVPVWYEIWRQMNGFPPKFYENIGGEPVIPDKAKTFDSKEKQEEYP